MYHRNHRNGQFSRKQKFGLYFILLAVCVLVAHITYTSSALDNEIRAANFIPVPTIAFADETLDSKVDKLLTAKIEKLKDGVVDDLAAKCETRGAKEPDAVIIFDSNNEASIGHLQFQIKTVQAYVKKFEQRDITRLEAIQTATDHQKIHDLAKKIIFEEAGGLDNWLNCSRKLDLYSRVAAIKALTN